MNGQLLGEIRIMTTLTIFLHFRSTGQGSSYASIQIMRTTLVLKKYSDKISWKFKKKNAQWQLMSRINNLLVLKYWQVWASILEWVQELVIWCGCVLFDALLNPEYSLQSHNTASGCEKYTHSYKIHSCFHVYQAEKWLRMRKYCARSLFLNVNKYKISFHSAFYIVFNLFPGHPQSQKTSYKNCVIYWIIG